MWITGPTARTVRKRGLLPEDKRLLTHCLAPLIMYKDLHRRGSDATIASD